MPVVAATELVSAGRCSEMDIVPDLWLSTVYNDEQVQGSNMGPVVYLRNGTGSPLVNYSELAARWGISRATVGRILKKLAGMLKRFDTGIYFIPKKTIFKSGSTISAMQVIEKNI